MTAGRRGRALIAGLLLIAATNAAALIGVAYNRSPDPEATLPLTERELNLPYRWGLDRDNSGISLGLQWRVLGEAQAYGHHAAYAPLEWLDKARLAELGFDVARFEDDPAGRRHVGRIPARAVLLVLEFDGPAYAAMLARTREWASRELEHAAVDARAGKSDSTRADQARRALDREQRIASRLFVVDAGLNVAALRARYPDHGRYAIVHGRIKPTVTARTDGERVTGYIENIEVSSVNMARAHHAVFAPLREDSASASGTAPRYAVTLAFGRRLEPWVLAVTALDGKPE